jgi:uncharacterized protein (TIGR02145 family)
VGVKEIIEEKDQFHLFQNYPNPIKDQSIVSMYIPEKGTVNFMVTDVQGRVLNSSSWELEKGNHSFRFTPGSANLFFLTALWNNESRSIKILTTLPYTGTSCMLEYIGNTDKETTLRTSKIKSDMTMLESGILDAPVANETYTFQFATNIPCPGTPTVTYEGQVYNTIQICSQCWLKENLNVGTMIPGTQDMSNNSVIEKYCYKNEEDSCTKYGGLYQWGEIMQYTTQQGAQGICPPGWHIPTDEEWKVLEGAVDSQYGIGDTDWDIEGDFRGFDAGLNLKSTSDWKSGGNGNDLFEFSGLPGGGLVNDHLFLFVSINGLWWTSTVGNSGHKCFRQIYYYYPEVNRSGSYFSTDGYSVRCIKDN